MFLSRMLERRMDSAGRQQSAGNLNRLSSAAPQTGWFFAILFCFSPILSGCSMLSGKKSDDLAAIGGIRGPLERALYGEESSLEQGRKFTEAERRQARVCRETFEKGKYEEAISLCKKNAKNFKDSSLGEEAQFYLAESHFALNQYGKAQDAYDQLFQDYPSTRYVETSTRRMFFIAKTWLEISEPEARSAIRQVSGEKVVDETPVRKSSDPTIRARILPNFFDSSRPVFDTQGNALKCLKSIWMNDPTGPLADDALMLTATYHQRRENYVEADRYFEILREEYPDSPHLEDAFLLGAHVKQMSYQGPYYEGSDLIGARKLKEQSLQLFPASHERQQLRKDLDVLYLKEAERVWSKIEYYRRKNKPRSIAIACAELLSDYPDTPYADDARQILATIDRKAVEGLPEIPEFIESVPQVSPGSPGNSPGPVKSVSFPRNLLAPRGRAQL